MVSILVLKRISLILLLFREIRWPTILSPQLKKEEKTLLVCVTSPFPWLMPNLPCPNKVNESFRTSRRHLLRLLGKFHSENEMLESVTVHLGAGLNSVTPVRKADKGEALGKTSVAVFGQEDTSDPTEALKHVTKLILLCHLRDLHVP
jgi:hypothetical protein